MKKSAILDIFRGVKGDNETMIMPKSSKENAGIVCDLYEELKEKLSPEIFNLHQKLVDALEDGWHEEVDFFFTQGFKLGVLIGIECAEE